MAFPHRSVSITHPHTDTRFSYDGVLFPRHEGDHVVLNRFPDAVLQASEGFNVDRALVPSCVVVRFTTDSPTITAHFGTLETEKALKMPQYAVYRNGSTDPGDHEEFKFPGGTENPEFTIISETPGSQVTYEILLPSLNATCFKGLVLESGYDLSPNPTWDRPVYVAIGDSITMSAGHQSKSYETFTWKFGRARGMEVYNLAVSGAKTNADFGSIFPNLEPELITVLFGINDWNTANDTGLFRSKYSELLDNIRDDHPLTPLFCINLVAINDSVNPVGSNGLTVNAYRREIIEMIEDRRNAGDSNIYLVPGHELTDSMDLQDAFHFHRQGTTKFADALGSFVDDVLANGTVPVIDPIPENTFSDWAAFHGINGSRDSFALNSDNDRLTRFQEFALMENPHSAARPPYSPSLRPDGTGGWTYAYPRRINADQLGIHYEVEFSDNLRAHSWQTLALPPTDPEAINEEMEMIIHELPPGEAGFVRLKITPQAE